MMITEVAGKYSRSKAAKPADGWAVFNKERFARYALLIATGIRSRLDDIIEALEEEGEPRSVRAKQGTASRKQKATRKR